MTDEHAAGASSARNKLAKALRQIRVPVHSSRGDNYPPNDEDFIRAIRGFLAGDQSPEDAIVTFRFSNVQYEFRILDEVISRLVSNPNQSHPLFSGVVQGVRSEFFLAALEQGTSVTVQRRKEGQGTEAFASTVLRPDGSKLEYQPPEKTYPELRKALGLD
jgi:hypothetical protein